MTNIHIDDEHIWRKKFGDKIKRMIHIRNMTQGRLAYELGISEVVLSRYITGTCMPDPYRLQQIANILECDLNCLFDIDN
jgi:transcriptional regulator with XRE-family HTH domain